MMISFLILADPSRRRIVDGCCADGERSVNDIVDALDIHQSGALTASAHPERHRVREDAARRGQAALFASPGAFSPARSVGGAVPRPLEAGSIDSQKPLERKQKARAAKENDP